jgi:hypothetical protein
VASKSQSVRLIDVFVLGPFMVAAGFRKSTLPVWMRVGLVGSGVATSAYNLANYRATRDEEELAPGTRALVQAVEEEMAAGADFEEAQATVREKLEQDPYHYDGAPPL